MLDIMSITQLVHMNFKPREMYHLEKQINNELVQLLQSGHLRSTPASFWLLKLLQ